MKKLLFLSAFLVSMSFGADAMVVKDSRYGVSQTIQNIKETAIRKGLGVFAIINYKGNAGMVGMELEEAKLIIFSNPKIDTKLIKENIYTALDLPLKVLVYRAGESKVQLAYKKTMGLKNTYSLKNDDLLSLSDNMLNEITDKAIK